MQRWPLFCWLLELAVCNTYCIYRTLFPKWKSKARSPHKQVREALLHNLIVTGLEEIALTSTSKTSVTSPCPVPETLYFTKSRLGFSSKSHSRSGRHLKQLDPPKPCEYPPPSTHVLENRPTRTGCFFCRYKKQVGPWARSQKVAKSYFGCRECNVALCTACFSSFHHLAT